LDEERVGEEGGREEGQVLREGGKEGGREGGRLVIKFVRNRGALGNDKIRFR